MKNKQSTNISKHTKIFSLELGTLLCHEKPVGTEGSPEAS